MLAAGLSACEKATIEVEQFSSVGLINASPGAAAVDLLVDGLIVTPGRVAYLGASATKSGASTIYMPMRVGSRALKATVDTGKTSYYDYNIDGVAGGLYSTFLYDSLSGGKTKGFTLKDDLTLPTGTNTHVRFLHLAPNAPAVDVTLLRTSVTPNDSVTITNRSFVGASPNTTTLAVFSPIPGGTYTARVKLAGTQTVVATVPLTTTLVSGRIVTLYASGTAAGQPLAVRAVRNF
jgi:hypothetical protein